MADEELVWFRHLKKLGKSQGFVTYAQFNDALPVDIVHPLEIEAIVDRLQSSGVRVVPGPSHVAE